MTKVRIAKAEEAGAADKALGAVSAVGTGAYAVYKSLPYATGQETLYHGTSKANWEKIKKEGLRADKGGSGTLDYLGKSKEWTDQFGKDFVDKNGKGYVYATKNKNIANAYGIQSDFNYEQFKDVRENAAKNADFVRQAARGPGNGKRVKMNINYDDYLKNFEIDPDIGTATEQNSRLFGTPAEKAFQVGKDTASRTKLNIGPERISGSKASIGSRLKSIKRYLPEYYKKHTARGLKGLAGVAAGATLMGYGVSQMRDKTASDSLFTLGFMSKLAFTARDFNQAAWRAAGGFAKETKPWQKAFTPGLTPKIETNIVKRLSSNPEKYRKYTEMLASRSSKQYTGNNIGKQIGSQQYQNLGKTIKEVDPERALKGIHKGNHVIFRKARDWNKANGIKVEVKNNAIKSYLGAHFDGDTKAITKRSLNIPLKKKKNLSDEFERNMGVRHEINELDLDKSRSMDMLGRLPSGKPIVARRGIGTHTSMGVLGREQVLLRDAPDEVYNKYVNIRTTNQYADWKKLDKLKEIHGVSVKPYGKDLRYRPKEVKQVDAAAYKSTLATKQKYLKYNKFINDIDDKYHYAFPTKMLKPMKAALKRGDDALEVLHLRDNGALGRISKVRDYAEERLNREFNPMW